MPEEQIQEELYALFAQYVLDNLSNEGRDELINKCVEEVAVAGGAYYLESNNHQIRIPNE